MYPCPSAPFCRVACLHKQSTTSLVSWSRDQRSSHCCSAWHPGRVEVAAVGSSIRKVRGVEGLVTAAYLDAVQAEYCWSCCVVVRRIGCLLDPLTRPFLLLLLPRECRCFTPGVPATLLLLWLLLPPPLLLHMVPILCCCGI